MKDKFLKKIAELFSYKLVDKRTYKNNRLLSKYSSLTIKKAFKLMAERVGFEPTVPVRVHALSKRALISKIKYTNAYLNS